MVSFTCQRNRSDTVTYVAAGMLGHAVLAQDCRCWAHASCNAHTIGATAAASVGSNSTCTSCAPDVPAQTIEFYANGTAIEEYKPRTPQQLGLHPRDVVLFAPLSRLAAPQVNYGADAAAAADVCWCCWPLANAIS